MSDLLQPGSWCSSCGNTTRYPNSVHSTEAIQTVTMTTDGDNLASAIGDNAGVMRSVRLGGSACDS